jgi:cobalt-zinc-cadmium efflux system outer membrane protein
LEAQTPLSLSEAIRYAQANHPQLLAAQERVHVAATTRVQAGMRPNPRLTLQTENIRGWQSPSFSFPRDTDDFAYLTHVFESAGKRAKRLEVAEAGVRSAEAEAALLARQIASRVSLAYWSAAAAQSLRDLLLEDVANFDRIVTYHRDRVREGAMAEVDLMRILLEHDRLRLTAQNAGHDAARASIVLLREMGRTDFKPIRLADSITDARDLNPPEIADVLAQRPEMDAARRSIEQARANLTLQRAMARPDTEVSFGYKRTSGLNTLMGIVGLDLPFFNRNQGGIATASGSLRLAEAQLNATESQVRAEVAAAWAEYEGRKRTLNEILRPMRERADEISRIALAAYREGGADLLRLLDAERVRIESVTLFYRALSEYQQSVTNLQIATGAPL